MIFCLISIKLWPFGPVWKLNIKKMEHISNKFLHRTLSIHWFCFTFSSFYFKICCIGFRNHSNESCCNNLRGRRDFLSNWLWYEEDDSTVKHRKLHTHTRCPLRTEKWLKDGTWMRLSEGIRACTPWISSQHQVCLAVFLSVRQQRAKAVGFRRCQWLSRSLRFRIRHLYSAICS